MSSRDRPLISRHRSLEASRRALARSAWLVRYGLFGAGLTVFLDQVKPLVSDAQFTWGERRVMGIVAVSTIGGFWVAGWVAGRLLTAAADVIEVIVEGSEAMVQAGYLLETQVGPGLVRATAALERMSGAQADGAAVAAARKAVADGSWGRAEQLVEGLRRSPGGVREADAIGAELEAARQAEVDDLLGRLKAARAAEEPDRVIDCRDALTRHLRGDALRDLDRKVVRWLAELVNDRAGSGAVSRETALLAGRVADTFGDSPEGAAMLAALPMLRKRAGLCPLCERPYRGREDACPDCRG